MSDEPEMPTMTGPEIVEIRERVGFPRNLFASQIGVRFNSLVLYERGERPIAKEIERRARLLDGQGANPKRVGIAAFGSNFLVVKMSLIEAADLWIVEALPTIYPDRKAAIIGGRDYANLHGYDFVPIGFQAAVTRRASASSAG